jgi:hypothetical protein
MPDAQTAAATSAPAWKRWLIKAASAVADRTRGCLGSAALVSVFAGRDAIRAVALLLALALAQPAFAQTVPTAPPKLSPPKSSSPKSSSVKPPAKPAAKNPAPPKADAAAQSGPRIGVIPHIGASFTVQSIGLTVFGNDLKEIPIESWALDDLIVARVHAAAGPRFAVRRIAYPANAFETYDHPALLHIPDLKAIAQSIAGASGCERYVVVVAGRDQWSGTNQLIKGIGLVHRGGLIDRFNVTYLFALSSLVVYDGRTFETLKQAGGTLRDETLGERMLNDLVRPTPIHGPSRELEDFAWPPAPNAITALREPTRALLAAGLDTVLPKLLAQ